MIALNIHKVESIKITQTREQATSRKSYVKHIVVRSKDGESTFALFADNAEALKLRH